MMARHGKHARDGAGAEAASSGRPPGGSAGCGRAPGARRSTGAGSPSRRPSARTTPAPRPAAGRSWRAAQPVLLRPSCSCCSPSGAVSGVPRQGWRSALCHLCRGTPRKGWDFHPLSLSPSLVRIAHELHCTAGRAATKGDGEDLEGDEEVDVLRHLLLLVEQRRLTLEAQLLPVPLEAADDARRPLRAATPPLGLRALPLLGLQTGPGMLPCARAGCLRVWLPGNATERRAERRACFCNTQGGTPTRVAPRDGQLLGEGVCTPHSATPQVGLHPASHSTPSPETSRRRSPASPSSIDRRAGALRCKPRVDANPEQSSLQECQRR